MSVQHRRGIAESVEARNGHGGRGLFRSAAGCVLAMAMFLGACSSDNSTTPAAPLDITPKNVSISVGDAQQFSALNAQGAVTWSSSNNAIATVVSTGFSTGVSPGSVTITATDSRGSATATMVVKRPAALVLSANSLTFAQTTGTADPAAQVIQVTDGGDDKVGAVSISGIVAPQGQSTSWLTATLGGSTAPTQLTVRAAAGTLAPGVYSATISVGAGGASNGAQSVLVTFTITAAPAIQLSSTALSFNAIRSTGNPPAQTVNITNSGGGTLAQLSSSITYGAGQPTGWLTATLTGTSAPTVLTVQPSIGTLPDGTYSATIAVAASGASNSPRNITVSFVVISGSQIGLSTSALAFNAVRGAPNAAAQVVTVTNAGSGTLNQLTVSVAYQGSQPTGWLNATLGSQTAPTSITVQPTTGALADGTYNATITVASPGASNSPRTIAVTFVVVSSPSIGLSAQSISFAGNEGGASPPAQVVNIVNSGAGTLTGLSASVTYAAGQPTDWLTTVAINQQTAPATLTLRPTIVPLTPGTYTATVSVTSAVASNSPANIAVSLVVTTAPSLVLGTTNLSLTVLRGAAVAPTPVAVTALGGGVLTALTATVSGGGAAWLTATLTATTTPTTLVINANAAALTPGDYQASIVVSSPQAINGAQTLTVSLTVLWSYSLDIYPQIAPSCTSCHFAGGNLPNLSTAALFYNNLVNVQTTGRQPPYTLATTHPIRIVPGNASISYVVDEILKLPGANPMPTGAAVVPANIVTRFIAWINQGAPNN